MSLLDSIHTEETRLVDEWREREREKRNVIVMWRKSAAYCRGTNGRLTGTMDWGIPNEGNFEESMLAG